MNEKTSSTSPGHIVTGVEKIVRYLTEKDFALIDEKAVQFRGDIVRDLFGGREPPAPWSERLDRLRVTFYEEVSTIIPVIIELHSNRRAGGRRG